MRPMLESVEFFGTKLAGIDPGLNLLGGVSFGKGTVRPYIQGLVTISGVNVLAAQAGILFTL